MILKKKQKEIFKANKTQLSTTLSAVIDGHWFLFLGSFMTALRVVESCVLLVLNVSFFHVQVNFKKNNYPD